MTEEKIDEEITSKLLFKDYDIYNYYLSLKTKPFVILMGLTGSGKTKLALRFAKALTDNNEENYHVEPVEAGWIDKTALLGYYNPITDTYSCTPVLKLILKAYKNYVESVLANNPEAIEPYFIILDEMNLSKVEYYFSKFLSILETRKKVVLEFLIDQNSTPIENDKKLPMYLTESIYLHDENAFISTERGEKRLKIDIGDQNEETETYEYLSKYPDKSIPKRVRIPPNIYFTGTVNVDETTYMFSPKVLDRANSIELTKVDIKNFEKMIFGSSKATSEGIPIISRDDVLKDFTYEYKFGIDQKTILAKANEYKTQIKKFFVIIKELQGIFKKKAPKFKFGYRVINEMLKYIINTLDLRGTSDDAFNFAVQMQLKQKILAKIHGMKSELNKLFESLVKFGEKYVELKAFNKKVTAMKDEMDLRQVTSYM